jgi:hypothetical protein
MVNQDASEHSNVMSALFEEEHDKCSFDSRIAVSRTGSSDMCGGSTSPHGTK